MLVAVLLPWTSSPPARRQHGDSELRTCLQCHCARGSLDF